MKELFLPPIADGKRVLFVDLAKGVCILLVVLLHMGIDFPIVDHMRMPLYFLLSGIFFKDYGLKLTFVKKFNKLFIPFMVFNLIGAVYFYFERKYLSSTVPEFDLLGLLTLRKVTGVIWFLLALFWDNMIFMFLFRYLRNRLYIGIAVLGLTVIGVAMAMHDISDFYMASSLLSLPFFYAGFMLRSSPILTNATTMAQRTTSIIIGIVLMMLCAVYVRYVDSGEIGFSDTTIHSNMLMTPYILGMLSVLGILMICRGIIWLPVVHFMGRYSIIILCVHIFFVNFFTHLRQGLSLNTWPYVTATVLIVLALSIASIFVFRKYLPWICAQKDLLVIKNDKLSLAWDSDMVADVK